eukprot:757381-Hanusia_phi.AAC.11
MKVLTALEDKRAHSGDKSSKPGAWEQQKSWCMQQAQASLHVERGSKATSGGGGGGYRRMGY